MPVNLGNLFINGDGTIEDATSNHTLHSITNTTVDTSEKKFGSGSLNMGNTGKIYVNNSSAFNLGQNQFTIDFWIKSNFADTWQGIYEHRDSSSGLNDLTVYMNGSGQVFFNSRISGSNVVFVSTQSGVSANEWHHIAVVRRGSGLNDMSIFFDGVAQTLVWSTPLTVGAQMATMSTDPVIGQGESAGFGPGGHLDNFRWVNGLALWGTNFSLDSGSLLYQLPDYNPTRFDDVSKLYNISHRGNIRGKSKEGYIRPTLKQFYTSSPNFVDRNKPVDIYFNGYHYMTEESNIHGELASQVQVFGKMATIFNRKYTGALDIPLSAHLYTRIQDGLISTGPEPYDSNNRFGGLRLSHLNSDGVRVQAMELKRLSNYIFFGNVNWEPDYKLYEVPGGVGSIRLYSEIQSNTVRLRAYASWRPGGYTLNNAWRTINEGDFFDLFRTYGGNAPYSSSLPITVTDVYIADTTKTVEMFTHRDSQVDLSASSVINGLVTDYNVPAGTELKVAISFDNKSTWLTYSGGEFINSSAGNTIAELTTALTGYNVSAYSSLDFKITMSTTSEYYSPIIKRLDVNLG